MKTKKLILIAIILSFFATNNAFAIDGWGDLFDSSGDTGLTFTDYQGQITTLSSEGYDPALVASTDLREFVIKIVNYALGFLGLIAVLIVLYGGFLYMTALEDDARVTAGKNAIKYALIGIIIILGAFAIVNTVISAGGANQSTSGIRKITAGRTGTGFNSSAEEMRQIAADIYNGFSSLADITLEFKNIQNDASKTNLLPANLPNKASILNYLTGVKSTITSITTKVPEYSEAYSKLKRLERELERQIDTVKSLNSKILAKVSGGSYSECDPSDKDTDWSWDSFTNALLGEGPCEGYSTVYVKSLYNFWGADSDQRLYDILDSDENIFKENGKFKSLQKVWAEGLLLSPIIDEIKWAYEISLRESFYKLQEINNQLVSYYGNQDGINSNVQSQSDYEMMKKAYGFDRVELNMGYGVMQKSGEHFYNKILTWKLGGILDDPISEANRFLDAGLTYHSKLYKSIQNLKFVEARLTANVIEGSAPLTVIFDALATNDPAGGSLNKENIVWDLGGTLTNSELMGSSDYGTIKPSENITCDREGTVLTSEELEQEQKIGLTAQRCTFHKPGTYRAAIKIRSNESQTYAPGISVLTIKVNPPNTKIDLEMTPSGSEPIVLMRYNDDETLEVSKNIASVTLEQAKSGILFDASGTYAESYKWDFGNGDIRDFTGNPTATVTYSTSGRYIVRLEVLSKLGVVDRKVLTLDVSDLSARIIDPNKGKGLINTEITFDGSASRSDRGGIRSYKWDITPSEGQKRPENLEIKSVEGSTMSKLKYKFTYPLKYNINLTVTDNNGNTSTDSITDFEVTSAKPVAVFTTETKRENKPAEISFNAEKSFDPDGEEKYLSYKWTVHTTNDKYTFINNTSDTSKNPEIRFYQKGKYEVTLRVSDMLTNGENEEYGEMSKTIDIESVLDIEWGPATEVSKMINEDGFAELSFELVSSNAIAYEIDFGDGDSESGSLDTSKIITHRYTEADDYKVEAIVFNSDEEDSTIKKKVFIGDGENPVAKISLYIDNEQVYDLDEIINVSKKTQIRFDGSESKNIDGTGRLLNYSWDFGDTVRSSQKSVIHSYNELSPGDLGYFTVKLTVSDKNDPSLNSSDEVKIAVENLPPRFSSLQGIPRTERGSNTTPITVLMKVYGAEDPDGRITQYRWWYFDINDPDNELGSMITTVDNAQMTIGTNGPEGAEIEYGLGVELTDNDNLTYSSNELYDTNIVPKVKVVNGPNELPVAKFSVNATKVFLGDSLTFTSTSNDPDGNIVAYIWDLEGDGFYNNPATESATIEHIYDSKNLKGFDVRLKVRDDKGGEAVSPIVKVYVDAKSVPPEADFEFEFPDKENKLKVQFKDTSKADSEVNAKISKTLWDFDINTDSSGDMIRNNDIDARTSEPLWTFEKYGIYKVKLQVVDSLGESSEIVKDVVIGDVTSVYEPGIESTDEEETVVVTDLRPVKAVLDMSPEYLTGNSGIVIFDFSKSEGPIKYYSIDKNINFDSAPTNGVKDDDFDFITDKAGTWQTNFDKSWGDIEVKLTVTREDGEKDSVSKKIIFK